MFQSFHKILGTQVTVYVYIYRHTHIHRYKHTNILMFVQFKQPHFQTIFSVVTRIPILNHQILQKQI